MSVPEGRNKVFEFPIILGTAGHIDHGKTTLIKALTGVDCDRLAEEKKRGITIELGFAPLVLPDGRTVSVVDVPGHEKFIRQMVAGAAGIDAVIFVVAADEGVKAQTKEHLEILQLLGVKEGVVVVTKSDLVDEELLELALEEIKDEIRGTFLEGKPILCVSAISGKGLDALLKEIQALLDRVKPKSTEGAFFLPIDRAFQIKGVGTVVTGTAYRGTVDKNTQLEVLPLGREALVKSIQVHERSVPKAIAGQRVAIGLSGVSVDDLSRGDVLCEKEIFLPTRCLDVSLELLPSNKTPLRHWQRVRLHTGTSDVIARVSFLDRTSLSPGERCYAQLLTEEEIVATERQPFIIRFYSPLRTIGGGKVLYPYGEKPRGKKGRSEYIHFLSKIDSCTLPSELLLLHLKKNKWSTVRNLSIKLQQKHDYTKNLIDVLAKEKRLIALDAPDIEVLDIEVYEGLKDEIVRILKEYHEMEPESNGLPYELLFQRTSLRFPLRAARKITDKLIEEGILKETSGKVSIVDFEPVKEGKINELGAQIMEFCAKQGVNMATIEEIKKIFKDSQVDRALSMLKDTNKIFIASGGYVVDVNTLRKVINLLDGLGDITVGSVRDATGSSRKYILPLLELLDSLGITRRVQDKRILKRRDLP